MKLDLVEKFTSGSTMGIHLSLYASGELARNTEFRDRDPIWSLARLTPKRRELGNDRTRTRD
jgi:hypothetical protein